MEEMRVKLSTLWIFAMFSYMYSDIMSLIKTENLEAFLAGYVGSMPINEEFLLCAAVLMEYDEGTVDTETMKKVKEKAFEFLQAI